MTFPRPVQRADETQLVNPFAMNQAILIGLVEQRPQVKASIRRLEKALCEPFGIFPEFDFLVLDELGKNGNRTMLVHRLNSLAEASKVQAFENLLVIFVGHAQVAPDFQLLFSERGLNIKGEADARDWLDWETFTQWFSQIQTKNLMLAVDTNDSQALFHRDSLHLLQTLDEAEPGQKLLVAPHCDNDTSWAFQESTFFLEGMVEALEGWGARTDRGVVNAETLFAFLHKRIPEISHRKSGRRVEPYRLRWPEQPRSVFALTEPRHRAELDDGLKDALLQGRCLVWAGEWMSERCVPSPFPPRAQWEGLQRKVWLEYADFQREPGSLSHRLAALKLPTLDSGVDSGLVQACYQHDFERWVPTPTNPPPESKQPVLVRLSGIVSTPGYCYEWEDLEARFHRVQEWLRDTNWCDTLLLVGFPWDEPIARQWLEQLVSWVPRCWMVFPYSEEHDRVSWLRQLGVRLLFLSDEEAVQQLESLSHLRVGSETTRPVRAPLPRRSSSKPRQYRNNESPFVGLRPLLPNEDYLLMGRDEELVSLEGRATLREDVHASHKVVLWGEEGVGKTSLLRAGLIPTLEDVDRYRVFYIDSESPFLSLATQLQDMAHFAEPPTSQNVLERIGYLAEVSGQPILVVFDHLERFAGNDSTTMSSVFWSEFQAAVQQLELAWPNAPWRILVSIDTPTFPLLRDWIRYSDSPGVPRLRTRQLEPWTASEAGDVLTSTANLTTIPKPEEFVATVTKWLQRTGPGRSSQVLPGEVQLAGQQLFLQWTQLVTKPLKQRLPSAYFSLSTALSSWLEDGLKSKLSRAQGYVVSDILSCLVEESPRWKIRNWKELRNSLCELHKAVDVDAVKKLLVKQSVLAEVVTPEGEAISLGHSLWSTQARSQRQHDAVVAQNVHDAWKEHQQRQQPLLPKELQRPLVERLSVWEQLPAKEQGPIRKWQLHTRKKRNRQLLITVSAICCVLIGVALGGWFLLPPSQASQINTQMGVLLNDKSNEQSKFWLAVAALKKKPLQQKANGLLSKKLLSSEGKQACRILRALHHTTDGNVSSAVQQSTGRSGAFLVNRLECSPAVVLQGVKLQGALLRSAVLSQVNLKKANFQRSELKFVQLESADLEKANLRGAVLTGGSLLKANLKGASMEGTNLQLADLRNTVLTGSSIKQASLQGALFTSTQVPLLMKAKVGLQHATCLTGGVEKSKPSGIAGTCFLWHQGGAKGTAPAHCPAQLKGPIIMFPSLSKEGKCSGVLQQKVAMNAAFCPSPEHPACNEGKLCEKGKADACYRLGRRYEQGTKVSVDLTIASVMHQRACALNHQSSCYLLGSFYLLGRGVERDEVKAASYWSKVCKENHGEACAHLGVLYEKGWGVSRDVKKARELYAKACKQGAMRGCSGLGVFFLTGQVVKRSKRRGLSYLRKSCRKGFGPACYHLANQYRSKRRTRRRARRLYRNARTLLSNACQRDDAESCAMLGVLLEKGRGGRKNRTRAKDLYNKACQQSHGMGCNALGQLFFTGTGVRRSFSTARALFQKACDRHNAEGCDNLGSMYERARGVRRSYRKARLLYLKSCVMGYGWGCNDLGDIYNLGRGVRKSRRKARKWYRKACKLGVRSACR